MVRCTCRYVLPTHRWNTGWYLIWENVFLIDAIDADQALAKAKACARQEEGDDEGSLTVNERPATLVFGGIRKVVSVCHVKPSDELGNGDEITYSEFEVADQDALQRFIRGEDTAVCYFE